MRLARTSGAMPLSPQTILIALFLLFASTASAASAVLGLDFGTLNLKAALVKPGIPLEIVLTKDSKRKETAAVAFKPTLDSKKNIIAELGSYPERIYGGDALALQGRIPGDVFPNLKPLLGLASSAEAQAAISTYNSRYPALRVQYDDALGTSVLKSSAFAESEADWTVEQLLAMELSNVKHNAELMAGSRVSDAVITVPAFYTVEERRSIHTAAALAGLEVNALVSDGLAVGLDYAKSRVFPDVSKGEKPEINVVYDMGAGSTTATVLRLQSKNVKDVGRFNKTVQEVAVLGYGWDRTLGGDALNKVVLDHYMNELMEKSDVKSERADVLSNGRVLSRIWKEAEKARQVLSANTETSIGFEEILPGVDLRVKLSRSDFETMAAEYVDRVVKPLEDALSNAKISIDEVDSVILHGGCIRTPLVQKKLEEFVGGKAILRSNVNADESAVFGAAFKGAGLSPSFKVKEIRDSDIAGYVSGISFLDGGKQRKQNLFTVNSPVGNGATIKAVTFKDKQDFSFDIWQQVEGQERPLLGVQSTNLTASVQALQDNFGCTKEEISTRFNLRLGPVDGLPEVSGASVSCEVVGSGKGVGDSVKGWLGFGKKDGASEDGDAAEEPTEEVEAAQSSSTQTGDVAPEASPSASKEPEKAKKRTESIVVAFSTSLKGKPQPSKEQFKAMADRLAAFDRSDKARFAREEALNILESYTYQVRDFLGNGDHETVSSQSHRDEISSLLESTREWIEDAKEVAKATKEDFQDKLGSLKKLVEPIQKRKIELESRPAKIEALNSKLADAKEWMSRVQESVAAAASSASSAVESPSEAVDDLEDAVPEALKGFTPPNPFVESDASGISDVYERVSSWLAEATESQAKLTPDQEPFFTSRDVDSYIAELDRSISSLSNKATRAAREALAAFEKAQKASKKASTKTKSSTSTGSASVVSGAAEEPSTAPEPIPEEAAPEAENDVPPAVEESEEEKENHDEL